MCRPQSARHRQLTSSPNAFTPATPLLVVDHDMDHEPGDEYIRRIAAFIRANEQGLAAATPAVRRRPKAPRTADGGSSVFNPLGWFASDNSAPLANVKPVVLSFDIHHLYYLLMRMEAINIDGVGTLDVKAENPSRAMNYISIPGLDKSDALSLRSFTSTFSAVSRLSLGGGWWGRPPPQTVDAEIKYIYSSFTRLPALSLHAPEQRMVVEMANDHLDRALPLDAFKSLQILECVDVDPRVILGWDRLAMGLRSLTIRRSGVEDIADVFIGAVQEDKARREGRSVTPRSRRGRMPPSRQASFDASRLPDTVPEDSEDAMLTPTEESPSPNDVIPQPAESALPSYMWASLRYLCLAENALTFVPTSPLRHLTAVTHLDLSSNLLISVPPGLSALYSLNALNLSDNMIDSVLGIYTMLGQVLSLNLSRNRLESICGLERLMALERVDLRHNLVEESAEVGRLASLPNIAEVWIEGNPLTEIEEGYRIRCFDIFGKEGKSILLDGTPPGFYEKRYLTEQPPEQMSSSRTPAVAASPPVVPVGAPSPSAKGLSTPVHASPKISPAASAPTSQTASPQLAAVVSRGRKKKNKRIVDLEGGSEAGSSRSGSHTRILSDVGVRHESPSPTKPSTRKREAPAPQPSAPKSLKLAGGNLRTSSSSPQPPPKFVSRHTRRQTEFSPPSPSTPPGRSALDSIDIPSPPPSDRRTSAHRRSATMSSKPSSRHARVSASLYEPPPQAGDLGNAQKSEAEAFRARIEALRADMGDGWLKVFNQSHMSSPSPSPPVASG